MQDAVGRLPRVFGKLKHVFFQLDPGQFLVPEIRHDDGELSLEQVFEDGLVFLRSENELLAARINGVNDGIGLAAVVEENIKFNSIVGG